MSRNRIRLSFEAVQQTMLDDSSLAFFRELVETPSPSGYEQPVQKSVRAWAERWADSVETDVHGNVIAAVNPTGSPRILLDGHCDQIGLMVQHIDEKGFLYVVPIGGWDTQILLGQHVTVWSRSGPIVAVIARKPTHLLKPEERKRVPEMSELWVDIGAKDQTDAEESVAIGDPVTLTLGMRTMRHQLVCGPKMDNATGLFVVLEALRRLHGESFAPALFVVSAVQEEIGLRGAITAAFGVDPNVGIAVDVTHATDCPSIEKTAHGDVKLGAGPVVFRGPNINPIVFERLRSISKSDDLPIQIKGANRATANDANALQLTRAGVATACLGIPNRYMHSPVEIISLTDLDTAADLLARFVLTTPAGADFTP